MENSNRTILVTGATGHQGSAERKTGVPHFDSKFQIEEYVRASGLPYTILRPVFFLFNYKDMRSIVET